MKVRPWDRVASGQVLATIESSELARAVADYRKALADDQVKQKALTRSDDLLAHNAISEREYQQAQGDEQQSKAEVEAAREQVRVLGADPDHATEQLSVLAPRAGVILEIGASQGEFSQALAAPAPLCTVADIDTIWAVGDIYERDLSAAKSGEPAQVLLNAYPGQDMAGARKRGLGSRRSRDTHAAGTNRAPQYRRSHQAGNVRIDPSAAIFDPGNSSSRGSRHSRGQ